MTVSSYVRTARCMESSLDGLFACAHPTSVADSSQGIMGKPLPQILRKFRPQLILFARVLKAAPVCARRQTNPRSKGRSRVSVIGETTSRSYIDQRHRSVGNQGLSLG